MSLYGVNGEFFPVAPVKGTSLGAKMARSLFEYKGNPASFDCTEEQLARILNGSIEWADETRRNFELQELQEKCDRVSRAITYNGGAL